MACCVLLNRIHMPPDIRQIEDKLSCASSTSARSLRVSQRATSVTTVTLPKGRPRTRSLGSSVQASESYRLLKQPCTQTVTKGKKKNENLAKHDKVVPNILEKDSEKQEAQLPSCKRQTRSRHQLNDENPGSSNALAEEGNSQSKDKKTEVFPRRKRKRASSVEWDYSGSESTLPSNVPQGKSKSIPKARKRTASIDSDWVNALKDSSSDDDDLESTAGQRNGRLCHICGAKFCRPWLLRIHLHQHVSENSRPFACDQEGCEKAYSFKHHLTRHKSRSHSDLVVAAQTVKCPDEKCGRLFASGSGLKRHFNKLHSTESLKFPCPQCDKKFRKNKQLRFHLAEHAGEPPLKCSICKAGAYNDADMKRHKRTHKTYTCDVPGCEQIFTNYPSFRKHISEHTKCFKTLRCAHCNKEFNKKSNLRDHVMTHLGKKQIFVCPHTPCPRFYYQKRNLSSHIRLRHEKTSSFACSWPNCDLVFYTQKRLDYHISVHVNGKIRLRKEGPRRERKDAHKPRRAMAVKLTGVRIPRHVEKELLKEDNSNDFLKEETEEVTASSDYKFLQAASNAEKAKKKELAEKHSDKITLVDSKTESNSLGVDLLDMNESKLDDTRNEIPLPISEHLKDKTGITNTAEKEKICFVSCNNNQNIEVLDEVILAVDKIPLLVEEIDQTSVYVGKTFEISPNGVLVEVGNLEMENCSEMLPQATEEIIKNSFSQVSHHTSPAQSSCKTERRTKSLLDSNESGQTNTTSSYSLNDATVGEETSMLKEKSIGNTTVNIPNNNCCSSTVQEGTKTPLFSQEALAPAVLLLPEEPNDTKRDSEPMKKPSIFVEDRIIETKKSAICDSSLASAKDEIIDCVSDKFPQDKTGFSVNKESLQDETNLKVHLTENPIPKLVGNEATATLFAETTIEGSPLQTGVEVLLVIPKTNTVHFTSNNHADTTANEVLRALTENTEIFKKLEQDVALTEINGADCSISQTKCEESFHKVSVHEPSVSGILLPLLKHLSRRPDCKDKGCYKMSSQAPKILNTKKIKTSDEEKMTIAKLAQLFYNPFSCTGKRLLPLNGRVSYKQSLEGPTRNSSESDVSSVSETDGSGSEDNNLNEQEADDDDDNDDILSDNGSDGHDEDGEDEDEDEDYEADADEDEEEEVDEDDDDENGNNQAMEQLNGDNNNNDNGDDCGDNNSGREIDRDSNSNQSNQDNESEFGVDRALSPKQELNSSGGQIPRCGVVNTGGTADSNCEKENPSFVKENNISSCKVSPDNNVEVTLNETVNPKNTNHRKRLLSSTKSDNLFDKSNGNSLANNTTVPVVDPSASSPDSKQMTGRRSSKRIRNHQKKTTVQKKKSSNLVNPVINKHSKALVPKAEEAYDFDSSDSEPLAQKRRRLFNLCDSDDSRDADWQPSNKSVDSLHSSSSDEAVDSLHSSSTDEDLKDLKIPPYSPKACSKLPVNVWIDVLRQVSKKMQLSQTHVNN